MLRAVNPDLLAWDWERTNPFRWQVWLSLDGGATFILPDGYWLPGDGRQFAPDGEELHLIVGVDAAGREITGRSNAVQPSDAPAPPAIPPTPVLTQFEVIDNNGQIDVNIAWTWAGQGWPDTGQFYVDLQCDDTRDQSGGEMPLVHTTVNGPGRSCSLTNLGAAEDKAYYCRVQYRLGTTYSAFTDWMFGNPY